MKINHKNRKLFSSALAVSLLHVWGTGCKSRFDFQGGKKEGANSSTNDANPTAPTGDESSNSSGADEGTDSQDDTPANTSNNSTTTTPADTSNNTSTTNTTPSGGTPSDGSSTSTPTSESGPVAGIVAMQNGAPVSQIMASIPVVFVPTAETRDLNAKTTTCANPGIIKATWRTTQATFGTVTRSSIADCKQLTAGGVYTKAQQATIYLDVETEDHDKLTVQRTFAVIETSTQGGGGSGVNQTPSQKK
jgi:hypothetical protein